MTVLYIAGPMTGIPDYNVPTFMDAERALTARGYTVLNPARRPIRDDWTWADYMRPALHDVLNADAIALLPGWTKSRGAQLEVHIAHNLCTPVTTLQFVLRSEPRYVQAVLRSRVGAPA